MTTESFSQDLAALIKSVPTLHLKPGELDGGAPAVFAGNEPVFRCRSNELGNRYAALAVIAFEQLAAEPAKTVSAPSEAEPAVTPVCSAAVRADLAQRVSSVLSLQPELASKVPLWTKLVVAAVSPFMVGAENEASALPSSGSAAVVQAKVEVGLHDGILGFISWLSDTGKPGEQYSLERLAELAGEWEETHA
ncbi:hypothetical protein KBJ94_23380 [Pseudomonas sp. ITA]|uniref:hypothetical protein n=1 Tax=Pseudomonas sp. ITA TaxID=2825841 RepID=UPI0024964E41|nr:hypothetical protein [Pseudomonas sp. ITA]MDI2144996.1 hypothetical protein [Pseudomonas sp. ITA]